MGVELPKSWAQADIPIPEGGALDLPVMWRNKATGAPYDLTGYSAKMQIRADHASAVVLFELSTVNGRIVIDGPTGTITLKFTAAETAAFTFTNAVYDLQLTPPAGEPFRLMGGMIKVSPGVTA